MPRPDTYFTYDWINQAEQDLTALEAGSFTVSGEKTANFTVTIGSLEPVDVSLAAISAEVPAGATAGQFFIVTDSRSNSATFNITVDFQTNGYNLNGVAATDYIINSDGAGAQFYYVNAPIGWIAL